MKAVSFPWVPGHQKSSIKEKADELANIDSSQTFLVSEGFGNEMGSSAVTNMKIERVSWMRIKVFIG